MTIALVWQPASTHVRAASLLARIADPDAHGWLADAGRHPVEEREASVRGERARLYVPVDVAHPGGVVVVHGVHWKGIDEPRLQAFARTIAASGLAVLTPEIRELCDYRIDPASIETIGESVRTLSDTLGGARVGLMGLSFAGGLSLVAASDERVAASLAFVVSVGAHDDLGRVLRFFVTDEAARPDGSVLHAHAHDYGTVVLEYAHAEDFFPADDVEAARRTLRAVLHEDFDAAAGLARDLSPASQQRMEHILRHDTAALAPELLAEIDRLSARFAAVSPAAHVARLTVPALVLHGAGDVLIPPSEAEWLTRDIPPAMLRGALISRAIEHVGLEADTGMLDRLSLVHFMSEVLDLAGADAGTPPRKGVGNGVGVGVGVVSAAELGGHVTPRDPDRRVPAVGGGHVDLQRREPRREAMNVELRAPETHADVVRGSPTPTQ